VGALRIIVDVGQELASMRDKVAGTSSGKRTGIQKPGGAPSTPGGDTASGTIQVAAAHIDDVIESIGQIDVMRMQTHRELQAIRTLHEQLNTWRTLFLEKIRDSAASDQGNDGSQENTFYKAFAAQSGHIAKQLERLRDSLNQQNTEYAAVSYDLQQKVDRLRVVPLESLFRRLRRPVRDAARQEGKQVELVTEGGNIQLDRNVIQALYGPLLHLVRNALAHGIETPAARSANGKPEKGTLRLAARVSSDGANAPNPASPDAPSFSLQLLVEDDGAGLDFDVILNKARKRGLIEQDSNPDDSEIAALIFSPGFSTKAAANALAGRGVGMEVVHQEIVNLNGNVDVKSERSLGTQITLTVPVRTALQ
jgi:chemosensory pili system protein ChpA (sensor histidine kinase/response regulator)